MGIDPAEAVVDHLLSLLGEVVEQGPGQRGGLARGPPEVRGQVADQQAPDHVRQVVDRPAAGLEQDLFGPDLLPAGGDVAGADPNGGLNRVIVWVSDQLNHAGGVRGHDLAELGVELEGSFRLVAVDDDVGHAGPLDGRAVGVLLGVKLARDFLLDVAKLDADVLLGQWQGVAHQRVLHRRPSDSMRRSASRGPQVPARYSGR